MKRYAEDSGSLAELRAKMMLWKSERNFSSATIAGVGDGSQDCAHAHHRGQQMAMLRMLARICTAITVLLRTRWINAESCANIYAIRSRTHYLVGEAVGGQEDTASGRRGPKRDRAPGQEKIHEKCPEVIPAW